VSTKRSAPKAATMLLPRLRIDPAIIESSEESTTASQMSSQTIKFLNLEVPLGVNPYREMVLKCWSLVARLVKKGVYMRASPSA